jgi:hypothetical protein
VNVMNKSPIKDVLMHLRIRSKHRSQPGGCIDFY